MAKIKHTDPKFSGSILGVQFDKGEAESDKPIHLGLMRRLGHKVELSKAEKASAPAPVVQAEGEQAK